MASPVMIDAKNPLYSVNGVFNAIFIHGNVLGDAMFYGSGAGKLPTASAVVADVVDCAKNKGRNIMMSWSEEKLNLLQIFLVILRFIFKDLCRIQRNPYHIPPVPMPDTGHLSVPDRTQPS